MNAITQQPQPAVLRRMSVHEASFPVYAELSPGAGNVVSCLELEGELAEGAAEAALQQLQQRHVLLRAGYTNLAAAGAPADYHFIELPGSAIPLRQLSVDTQAEFNAKSDEILHALLNHHHLHGGLLSRAVMLTCTASTPARHRFSFCVNHAVCDGSAMVQLLNEWQQSLNGSPLANVATTPAALWDSMPPAIEGGAGAFRSMDTLLQFVQLQKQADRGLSFDFDVQAPASERRCIAVSRSLNHDTFAQLRAHVKTQGGSLHGMLAAAVLAAFTDYLAAQRDLSTLQDSTQSLNIPLVTTVDMRAKTTPPLASDSIACLSSGLTSTVRLPLTALQNSSAFPYADLAHQVSTGINTALASGQHWKVLRIYKLAGLKGLRKMFAQASQKALSTPLSLANLGRVSFTPGPQLRVVHVDIYAAFHAMGPSMNIAINSLNDQLTLCITCPYPVCSRATLNRFADACLRHLHNMAGAVQHPL